VKHKFTPQDVIQQHFKTLNTEHTQTTLENWLLC